MIDTKELRRLAQAATHPTTKGRWIRLFGERTVYDRLEDGCRGIPVVSTPAHPPHPFEAACLDFIAAANPAAVTELLDRLEAAESDAAHQKALADSALRVAEGWEEKRNALHAAVRHEADCVDAAKAEIEAMRAKITEMEKQGSVAWRTFDGEGGYDYRNVADNEDYQAVWEARNPNHKGWVEPLYLAPGAQPEEYDTSKALIDLLRAERDALRAKIEAMERQKPVMWANSSNIVSARVNQERGTVGDQHTCAETKTAYRDVPLYALPGAQNVPEKLCYDSRWKISIDYVDGWNAPIDAVRGKSPSWYCPDCCIVFPFGEPKSCPHDDARCNRALKAAPEGK